MRRTTYYDIQCKTALNRVRHMGFAWSLNPYQGCFHSCHYCFARAHAKLADRDPGEGFSARVGVKVNVAEVLRSELASPRWRWETVAFGTATDPYQPVEGQRRLTRGCLETLRDYRTPVGLITKGTMVLRDLDVLVDLSRRACTTVCLSVPTVDESVWRATEPGTPHPRQRLRVLRRLVDAGVEAGVAMAPLLPGLSDRPQQLASTVAAAAEAGACFLFASVAYLKPGTKEHFFAFLQREYPHLLGRYQHLYEGVYAPAPLKASVERQVRALQERWQLRDRRTWRAEPPSEPEQLRLLS